MSLLRVPIYPTRNLAVEIDPGARSIVAGTNVSFTTNADGSITINASGGGTGTVTSVGATGSTGLTISGSPITTSGTLTFTLSANLQSWSGIAPSSKADTSALGNYVLKAGDTMTGALIVNGGGIDATGTINSSTFAISGVAGTQGFQIMWNTVQSGQGRMEYINNRGGASGGFTWWDRANTGAGAGTALAALTSAGLFVNGVLQFNTSGVSVGQLLAWPGNSSYVAFGNTAMSSTEYAVLTASPSVDSTTYISSAAGGSVRIRPSANSTVGEAVFSTSGLALAKYVWPDANTAGSKKLSRISIGTAAPSGLIDGELYLRY